MDEPYTIKTEVFEGPLDTLLSLIEKRKLLINEISLAKVTEDYIAHIEHLTDVTLDDRSQFIYIASTLVLIKSKSLLPTLDLSVEEEASIEDLEKRLKIHQLYKELASEIKSMFGKRLLFFKTPHTRDVSVFVPDSRVTKEYLFSCVEKVLQMIPVPEKTPQAIVKKTISIEEAIVGLTDRIGKQLKLSFKQYAQVGKKDKVHVIVNFLALLELVKQGMIEVKQTEPFHDIEMETAQVGVPRYHQ